MPPRPMVSRMVYWDVSGSDETSDGGPSGASSLLCVSIGMVCWSGSTAGTLLLLPPSLLASVFILLFSGLRFTVPRLPGPYHKWPGKHTRKAGSYVLSADRICIRAMAPIAKKALEILLLSVRHSNYTEMRGKNRLISRKGN